MDFAKGFDLRAAAEKGAWLQLIHPATDEELGVAEGNPCRIHLKGADSMSYEEAVARTVAMRSKETPPRKGRVTADKLLEAADRNADAQAEELAAITIGWEHFEWDGEDFPFTHENAVRLYTEHRWIREQAIDFFGDRSNYLGNG